jgi:hypothetical protein
MDSRLYNSRTYLSGKGISSVRIGVQCRIQLARRPFVRRPFVVTWTSVKKVIV